MENSISLSPEIAYLIFLSFSYRFLCASSYLLTCFYLCFYCISTNLPLNPASTLTLASNYSLAAVYYTLVPSSSPVVIAKELSSCSW